MIQAILLAGGKSERMGENKMLLPLCDETIIIHNLKKLLSEVDEVIVVTGRYDHEIRNHLSKYGSSLNHRIVHNTDYELGMFSSVLAGAALVESDVVIVLGDSPFYSVDTLRTLLDTEGDMIVPSYKEKGGHPIVIRKALVTKLRAMPITSNLKVFRNAQNITWVDVNDQGILTDVDTVRQYEKAKKAYEATN